MSYLHRSPRYRALLFPVALSLLLAACDDDATPMTEPGSDATEDTTPPEDTSEDSTPEDTTEDSGDTDAEAEAPPEAVLTEGCNPLAWRNDCLLPYPSDHFREETTEGWTIELPDVALVQPRSATSPPVHPFRDFPTDGFSHHQPILAFFPEGVDDSTFPTFIDDLEDSITATHTSLLLKTSTGEFVPHFLELDRQNPDREDRVLILRPLAALDFETRYIVAFQGLTSPGGQPIAAPDGFRLLRDEEVSSIPEEENALQPLRDRYNADVFGPLNDLGVTRGDLQLAWDFTTQSFEAVSRDMLQMRSLLLASLEADPIDVQNLVVREGDDLPENLRDNVARLITGEFLVPTVVESAALDARMRRDAEGNVTLGERAAYPFTAIIPQSVLDADDPSTARVIQFGHGFFGSQDEVRDFPRHLAAQLGAVIVATDWVGMSTPDAGQAISTIISNLPDVFRFVHRAHQGMANQLALSSAIQDLFTTHEAFLLDGEPLYDPSTLSFFGISQGHILGGTFVALSPVIDRAVLHVGGMAFTFMMSRANPFDAFLRPVIGQIQGPVEAQKFITLSAHALDRIDPGTWARVTLTDTLEGSPAERTILMHAGIGDTQVPNFGTHLHARTMGLPLLSPHPRSLPFLSVEEGPLSSALVEFDAGIDPLPDLISRTMTRINPVHNELRRQSVVREQIDRFLRADGRVEHVCGDVPCVVSLSE